MRDRWVADAGVGLRVVHSLVQALPSVFENRFVVFVLSTLPLFGLVCLAALRLP